MDVVRGEDGYWWITRVPDTLDCGPYGRRIDAESDRRGMTRFFRYADEPGFITADRRPSQAETASAAPASGRHSTDPVGSQSAAAPEPLTTES